MEGRRRRRWRTTWRWKTGTVGLVKWMFVVYKRTTIPPLFPLPPLFLLSSGLARFDIVLFFVCENQILQHPGSSCFGIRSGRRTGQNNPIRTSCLDIWRLKGQVQIERCVIRKLLFALLSVFGVEQAEKPPDYRTHGPVRGLNKKM